MIAISTIQAHVAASFGIGRIDMISERRARAVARPRQVAMYLARHLTGQSLPAIGRAFGKRDHTTILAGVRRVESLLEADADFYAMVLMLRQELETEPEMV